MQEPVYVGVFLDSESKERLLSFVPPIHSEVHADHMTIKFRPTQLEINNTMIGMKVRLKVISSVHDEKGQAVFVHGVLSANKYAHITISVNKERGGRPAYSNDLLEKIGTNEDGVVFKTLFPETLMLDGVVDIFPRTITQ